MTQAGFLRCFHGRHGAAIIATAVIVRTSFVAILALSCTAIFRRAKVPGFTSCQLISTMPVKGKFPRGLPGKLMWGLAAAG